MTNQADDIDDLAGEPATLSPSSFRLFCSEACQGFTVVSMNSATGAMTARFQRAQRITPCCACCWISCGHDSRRVHLLWSPAHFC